VFDRLEMSVLFEIASQIAPRKMSDILGLMSPEAAERLTVEMARRAGADSATAAATFPRSRARCCRQRAISRVFNKTLNCQFYIRSRGDPPATGSLKRKTRCKWRERLPLESGC